MQYTESAQTILNTIDLAKRFYTLHQENVKIMFNLISRQSAAKFDITKKHAAWTKARLTNLSKVVIKATHDDYRLAKVDLQQLANDRRENGELMAETSHAMTVAMDELCDLCVYSFSGDNPFNMEEVRIFGVVYKDWLLVSEVSHVAWS